MGKLLRVVRCVCILMLFSHCVTAVQAEDTVDCVSDSKLVQDKLRETSADIAAAAARNDRIATCHFIEAEIIELDQAMGLVGSCRIMEGKSHVERVTILNVAREKLLAAQEMGCVGIGNVQATPPGHFNCHSVAMRVLGQLLLDRAAVADAVQTEDRVRQCTAAKDALTIYDQLRDLASRPGCYSSVQPNPLFGPQTEGEITGYKAIAERTCSRP